MVATVRLKPVRPASSTGHTSATGSHERDGHSIQAQVPSLLRKAFQRNSRPKLKRTPTIAPTKMPRMARWRTRRESG